MLSEICTYKSLELESQLYRGPFMQQEKHKRGLPYMPPLLHLRLLSAAGKSTPWPKQEAVSACPKYQKS